MYTCFSFSGLVCFIVWTNDSLCGFEARKVMLLYLLFCRSYKYFKLIIIISKSNGSETLHEISIA
jgi:hypothetical protein